MVAAGEGARFPSTYPFHISIDNEILRVTNRATDTMTVTRAQEGTAAAIHNQGATIQLNITAKAIADLNAAINAIEGGSMLDDTPGGTDGLLTKAPTSNAFYDFCELKKVKLFSRDMTAASGNVAYTGIGFKPRAIIFFSGMEGEAGLSWGFVDSVLGQGLIVKNSVGIVSHAGTLCIYISKAGWADNQNAALVSLDADGFTLAWTKVGSPTSIGDILVLCLR